MLSDTATMLDDEPTAIYSQATSPPFPEMDFLNLGLQGLNDDPGILQQVANHQ